MERGVVYSAIPNPTINSQRIIIGSGIGVFDSISPLEYQYPHLLNQNTTYYVRSYVYTENGNYTYGNDVSFKTLSIGQTGPGGGIVFFDKGVFSNGWRYLEAAPNDQSTGIGWGCNGISIPGTKLSVGSGEDNTGLIVAGCNVPSFAAKLCDNLTLGGQSDWFLPSINELNLMHKSLHLKGKGNFNNSRFYWSSTEYAKNNAWDFAFSIGQPINYLNNNKGDINHVRAVRAF